ncbi:hypothetical protein P153DRAFT_368974 [Dothidotthia symphoricarpi CBS 119687]|uniref:Uncharacterized protein n=1 Tax=Dothidotthia symphoricarpi CBS 119687 TaxID=1392245 RepID=A0A6A6A739_9PLEO|nr:uncharacterized protein P153DRAFT_368974 [Dothidotthia symphoricarpi CBS 119687]KAF2126953.1 hypothetical protein P153DRAFT_368974 [Dothidotthia symphoricarpi CBS 119687]
MELPNESTLYPKITNHITDIIKTLQHLNQNPENLEEEVHLEPISIVGMVKLHGTHADVLVYNDDSIVFQSRNIVHLQTSKDNQGFAKAMSSKTKTLLRLRNLYIARWTQLNPSATLDPTHPVLIAGEWIGSNIQKGVAISQLSKRFVIVSVNINGKWVRDSDYIAITVPNQDIYNVSRGGRFRATLYPDDPQRTQTELEIMAEQVAARCPFAATFGVDGEGEGLVWKLAPAQYNANPALWFKTKGGKFKPTFAHPPKKQSETEEEKRHVAAAAAEIWCSEQRLEQGWDILREKSFEQGMRGLGEFLKWMQRDILVEEKTYIVEHKVDEAMLRIEIAKIAKPWFMAQIASSRD